MAPRPITVISGGQTGVDRAAWDAARALGLPIGGWVPRGRRAEDGVIPAEYGPLRETREDDTSVRTEGNVRDSDATLVLHRGAPTGGTRLTIELARALGRPLLTIDLAAHDPASAASEVRRWLRTVAPARLNVAGPRASGDPGLPAIARRVLEEALADRRSAPRSGD